MLKGEWEYLKSQSRGSEQLSSAHDVAAFLSSVPERVRLQMVRRVLEGVVAKRQARGAEPSSKQCSMFGVWGARTVGGHVFGCRNLDWAVRCGVRADGSMGALVSHTMHDLICARGSQPDLGLNQWKLVTVYRPNDGSIAHATIGYVAMYGALAGMSSAGISVSEANLEEVRWRTTDM